MVHATDLPVEVWMMIFDRAYGHHFHDYLLGNFPFNNRNPRCLGPLATDSPPWSLPQLTICRHLYAAGKMVYNQKAHLSLRRLCAAPPSRASSADSTSRASSPDSTSDYSTSDSTSRASSPDSTSRASPPDSTSRASPPNSTSRASSPDSTEDQPLAPETKQCISHNTFARYLDVTSTDDHQSKSSTSTLLADKLKLFPLLERCHLRGHSNSDISHRLELPASLNMPPSMEWLTLTSCVLSEGVLRMILSLPALRRLHLFRIEAGEGFLNLGDEEPDMHSSSNSATGLRYVLTSAVALSVTRVVLQCANELVTLDCEQGHSPRPGRTPAAITDVLSALPGSIKSVSLGLQEPDFIAILSQTAVSDQALWYEPGTLPQLQHLSLHFNFTLCHHSLYQLLRTLGPCMDQLLSLDIVCHARYFFAQSYTAIDLRKRLIDLADTLAQFFSLTTEEDPSQYLNFVSLRNLSLPIHFQAHGYSRAWWCPALEHILKQRGLRTPAGDPWCRTEFEALSVRYHSPSKETER